MRRYPFLVHVIHGLIDPAIGIYGPAQMAAPEPCSVSLPSYYGRLDLCTYLSQWSVQLADRFQIPLVTPILRSTLSLTLSRSRSNRFSSRLKTANVCIRWK